MKPEKLKKPSKLLRMLEREHSKLNKLLRRRSRHKSPRPLSLKRELLKLLLIWRRHRRRLPTGRSRLKLLRKRLPRKWLMQKLLKRREKRNLRPLDRLQRLNMLLLSKSNKKPSKRLLKQLRKHTRLLRKKGKPERLSKLLLTKKLWLIEEPNLRRNSEMSGAEEPLVFLTCK